ncbi:MAG TPA: hypothetical protein VK879_15540 [Candidatus Sulfomarinibacteraceae bacterium]|nr:hypothetical protein [Candidatus Sulfomarinibacteraceae bacterium]
MSVLIKRLAIISFSVLLAACTASADPTVAPSGPAATLPVETVQSPSPTSQPPPATTATGIAGLPTFAPTSEPSATSPPTAAPTATDEPTAPPPPPEGGDLSLSAEDVFLYPVPEIYDGDVVTFYVMANVPDIIEPGAVSVQIDVGDHLTLPGALTGRNLAGDAVALFAWSWDTQGMAGEHEVTVTLDPDDTITVGDENPDNNQVVLTVPVHPPQARPWPEANQSWVTAEIECCVLRVVSDTAAHRDLEQLKQTAQQAVDQASERLQVQPESKIDIYLIDRVIGQGGYARSNVVISYLDRNYAGGGLHEVLVHETVHLLDRQFAPNRIPFLAEGLAVWAAGGHYKQENILQRVKGLREAGLYVPLHDVIDNFYDHQHEIGYLEAAGLIDYIVRRYGWETVRNFYSDVVPQGREDHSATVERSLQLHLGRSLAQFEEEWLREVDAAPRDPAAANDLLTTIRYYDVMRDYQLLYDPTAHFLKAWLPFPQELEQRQLTADLTRHPTDQINVTLEVMLYAVDQALMEGEYNRANVILDSVERALANNGNFVDPLGANYQEIVSKLSGLGLEVHSVELRGNEAVVLISEGNRTRLRTLTMALKNQNWVLLN